MGGTLYVLLIYSTLVAMWKKLVEDQTQIGNQLRIRKIRTFGSRESQPDSEGVYKKIQ
jgi:hypothetical protein